MSISTRSSINNDDVEVEVEVEVDAELYGLLTLMSDDELVELHQVI